MKVLYVAGMPHSGSTILGNTMGELEGFFCAGELCFLEWALRGGRCGCGADVGDCPLWTNVLGHGSERLDLAEFGLDPNRHPHARLFPPAVLAGAGLARADTIRYVGVLGELYARVQTVTGCRVLVDTSKSPTYGYLLGRAPGIELYVVHLVRDARATALSWRLSQEGCDDDPLLLGPMWNVWNALTPIFARSTVRHCLVRYEDFVNRPKATVQQLVELVDESVDGLPFVSEREVVLRPNHIVYGNSSRFRTGLVRLEKDERWRATPPIAADLVTRLTTWPLQAFLYRR